MVLSTILKMRALMYIVAECNNFKDPLKFIDAISLHIRQDIPDTQRLIHQLSIEGCLDQHAVTGMFSPTKKGKDEAARFLRIVEQKI